MHADLILVICTYLRRDGRKGLGVTRDGLFAIVPEAVCDRESILGLSDALFKPYLMKPDSL